MCSHQFYVNKLIEKLFPKTPKNKCTPESSYNFMDAYVRNENESCIVGEISRMNREHHNSSCLKKKNSTK